jgi:pyruvate dehydrogenase (quinone)
MANTPKQALNGLQTAIQHAISHKGVAVLGLPGDVASAEIEPVQTLLQQKFLHCNLELFQALKIIAELASQIINTNEKVVLFCGHGCRYAVDDVMQLAKRLHAPLGYSFRGKIFFERARTIPMLLD